MKEGYKETPIGMIPEDWDIVKIQEIADVKGGKRLPKGESLVETVTPYPYIRVTDMYMGGVHTENLLYVPEHIQPSIKRYTIGKDDLFISVAGTLGIVGKIPIELDGANLTENADKLTNIQCDKVFLLQVLLSNIFQKSVKNDTTSNAQPKLALTRIQQFLIPLPSITEQSQIAAILSTFDDKIDAISERITQTQQFKNGLMQRLLTKGIGHTKFKDSPLGEIPDSWEIKRLDQICKMITDGSHFSPTPITDSSFYIATVKDMQERSFNLSSCARISKIDYDLLVRNGCKPKQNDVLFSKDGSIGKTFVFDGNQDLVVLSSIAIIEPDPTSLHSHFLSQYLKSSVFLDQLEGLKSGSAIRRLVLKAIKEIKILLPRNIDEQKQISSILKAFDEKLEVLQEKKTQYNQLKQALMQQLLTGKIRIKNT